MAKALTTVLTIREAEIIAIQFDREGQEVTSVEIPVESGDLADAFIRLKADLDFPRARIFLPEDKTFLLTFHVDFNTENVREIIEQQLPNLTPEPVDNLIYDYQTVGKDHHGLVIQVIASIKNYLNQLEDAAAQAGFDIERTEPMSFAMARDTAAAAKPHLIVYADVQTHLVVAHHGRVFASLATYSHKFLVQQSHDLINYAQTHYGLKVEELITNRRKPEIQHLAEVHQLKLQENDINPSLNFAMYGKSEDADDVMTFDLEQVKHKKPPKTVSRVSQKKVYRQTPQPTRRTPRNSMVTSLLAFFIGAGMMFAGGVFVYDTFFDKPDQQPAVLSAKPTEKPTPTPTDTPTPTPTPEPKRTEITIKVLNGNGNVGVAAKAKSILTAKGYPSVETGNAGKYDYTNTEIRLKPTKAQYYALIANDIKDAYSVIAGVPLEASEPTDVVIIIGEK